MAGQPAEKAALTDKLSKRLKRMRNCITFFPLIQTWRFTFELMEIIFITLGSGGFLINIYFQYN